MLNSLRRMNRLQLSNVAHCSMSSHEHLNIKMTNSGYSIIEMKRKPMNNLDLQFTTELTDAINTLEKENKSRGLILTSNCKTYCAGIDLQEIHRPNEERARRFWTSFQELFLRLYSSPLVTVAAINGAAPAAGCLLTMACDHRIMADGKFVIGMNETQLGIPPHAWAGNLYASLVGYRVAEKNLWSAKLCSPQEALEIGLVDKVVSSEDLILSAEKSMTKWLGIPDFGRVGAKMNMRQDFINSFVKGKDEDLEKFINLMKNEGFQKGLDIYVKATMRKT